MRRRASDRRRFEPHPSIAARASAKCKDFPADSAGSLRWRRAGEKRLRSAHASRADARPWQACDAGSERQVCASSEMRRSVGERAKKRPDVTQVASGLLSVLRCFYAVPITSRGRSERLVGRERRK